MAGRRTCTRERFRRCLQIFLTHLFSHIGLCALVVAYTIGGAFLFQLLEAEQELHQRGEIQRFRENCLADLWHLSGNLTSQQWSNWTSVGGALLKEFENQVVTATKLKGYDGKEASDSERQWSFSGALFYSITVITTIGYGNLAPKTQAGKLITMLYALIGIPVMLLFLSNIGTSMANAFQFVFAQLYRCSPGCCDSRSRRRPTKNAPAPVRTRKTEPAHQILQECVKPVAVPIKQLATPVLKSCRPKLDLDDRIGIDDLTRFDYDVVDLPAASDHSFPNKTCQSGTGDVVFYNYHRLDDPAKNILRECSSYCLGQHDAASRTRVGLGFSSVPVKDDVINCSRSYRREGLLSRVFPFERKTAGPSADVFKVPGPPYSGVKVASDDESPSASIHANPIRFSTSISTVRSAARNFRDGSLVINDSVPDRDGQPASTLLISNENSKHQVWQEKRRVPVLIVLAFLVGYICVGAIVFSTWEEWEFLDGAYFSFITLSTIGFGDLVPGSKVLSTDTHEGQYKVVICSLYLVLGLAVIAMSFNLVQEEVVARFQKLGQELGILDEK